MSVNFKDLHILNFDEESTKILLKWNEQDILVNKFLPTNMKYDIVSISLQQAEEDGYYNPILLDMYFHLNLVFAYTDIIFDSEDTENLCQLYDNLRFSGLLTELLKIIDSDEYTEMLELIDEVKIARTKRNNSLASIAEKLINDLPTNAKAALDIVDNFDENKFEAVKNFAEAANGNRPIG